MIYLLNRTAALYVALWITVSITQFLALRSTTNPAAALVSLEMCPPKPPVFRLSETFQGE